MVQLVLERAIMHPAFKTSIFAAVFVIGCSGSSLTELGGGGTVPGADAGAENTTGESSSSSSSAVTGIEQTNGACPSRPTRLDGTAAVGEASTKASDCEPTCCSCDEGSGEWLAAACIDGKCASASKACSRTKKEDLCESSSSSSGSSKPPPTLDQQCGKLGFVRPSARTCEDCWSVTCCAQKKWCADTPECSYYLSCRTSCPGAPNGPACMQCDELYPVGATIIDGMVSCLGSSCDADCAQASMP